MADLVTVGFSVATTLTLQAAYLALIKFPKTLESESNALQSLARLSSAKESEIGHALRVIDKAADIVSKANDFLLDPNTSGNRLDIERELSVRKAKLSGLSAAKDPIPSHAAVVCECIERTIEMMDWQNPSEEAIRREAISIAWTNSSSMRSFTERLNEGRLVRSDEIEMRAANLDASLLEFWGASALFYVGVMGISALLLVAARNSNVLRTWMAIVIWVALASLITPAMSYFLRIGSAAKSIVQTSRTNVSLTRANLAKIFAQEDSA